MGTGKTLLVAVILGIIFVAEARIRGRRLRDGEPCDTPGFFGDANDCRKFYRCAEHPTEDENNPHLIRYSFRCPNGTVWDQDLTTCNHPEAVMDKPEPCQVYDPDEGDGQDMGMENKNKGSSWGLNQPFLFGGLLHNQNQALVQPQQHIQQQPQGQQQQQLLFPILRPQIIHPQIAIPYGNFIQFG